MKRTGYLYESICRYDNLYAAFKKAFRGSGRTVDACRFNFHLEGELLGLKREMEEGRYCPARYRYFMIQDPKERVISVAPFRDRVAHHALVRVIEPVFERTFIHDSYATRKGKGSHAAVRCAQVYLKRNEYFLKMDVEKYFESIDHGILLALLERKIKDERVLGLAVAIVRNSAESRGVQAEKGLPIGNLTSQFFANVYLDALDHFVKEEMRVKCYLRYMDDMVIFSDSREELKRCLGRVRDYLEASLRLRIKEKATLINSRLHGLSFLGFRVFPNLLRVRAENVRRIKKRLDRRVFEFNQGDMETERLIESVRSTFAHLGFADSLRLRNRVLVQRAGVG